MIEAGQVLAWIVCRVAIVVKKLFLLCEVLTRSCYDNFRANYIFASISCSSYIYRWWKFMFSWMFPLLRFFVSLWTCGLIFLIKIGLFVLLLPFKYAQNSTLFFLHWLMCPFENTWVRLSWKRRNDEFRSYWLYLICIRAVLWRWAEAFIDRLRKA